LTLAHDGRRLSGVEALTAMTAEAQRRFEDAMTATAMEGARFSIRFHLHPEVDATLDMGGLPFRWPAQRRDLDLPLHRPGRA
jgi:uncharacterized heparinase superfamily protein